MIDVELGVAKAYPNDCGRGIVRLDPETFRHLGVAAGDIVEIEGADRTVAKVWRADREDWETSTARVDSITRRNAGVGVADTTIIRNVDVLDADRVVLDPPEGRSNGFNAEAMYMVKRQAIGRALVEGDIVPVVSSSEHPFCSPLDVIQFGAVHTEPTGALIITGETTVELTGGVKGPAVSSTESADGVRERVVDEQTDTGPGIDIDEPAIELVDCELETGAQILTDGDHKDAMISGELKNVGDSTLEQVTVGVTFYGDTQMTVHLAHNVVSTHRLKAGTRWPFKIYCSTANDRLPRAYDIDVSVQ